MNARELRIGNLVECKGWGDTYTDRSPYYGECIFPVYSACKVFVKLEVGHDALQKERIERINPIPLTEEWLLKFGFFGDGFVWEKDEFIIGLYKTGYFHIPSKLILLQSTLSSKTGVEIKSVHQLQNLYFAITGDELTMTE